MTIRKSFALVMKAHGIKEKVAHESRMKELFETVGLPCDETFLARYPHQLSGGQQQRVAIAMAFAHSPKVVVMDEPTTGLDAMTTRKVIDLVKHMSEQFHASIVFVSHDLRLLFSLADRVAVLHNGQIVETLLAPNFIDQTTHTYTQQLINAIPKADDSHQSEKHALKTQVQDPEQNTVLCVKRLSASYGHKTVIHELDFSIDRGTCLAFIGESGSGKTTTALCIAGIHGAYDGHIVVEGEEFPQRLTKRSLAQRKAIQYVFQNSTAALNPRKTAGGSIIAALRSYHKLSRSQAWDRAISLVRDVGLRADHLHALPHQLSGGQKQRVCLARALAAEPALLICDEVTSSLDVIVQSEIIDLLHHLQQERNLTMLFITHDFGLARIISDKTIVLYQGQVVESGLTGQVIKVPQHPYTQSLVQAASFNTSS
jgi:peptide/nickel transport system ATP-binding protein